MYAVLKSFGLKGLNGFPVEVEADISGGMPAISIVGLIGFIALKPGMLKGCSDKDIAALEAALETQKAAD